MDNRRIDITNRGDISPAIELAFRGIKTVSHYKSRPDRLLLAWTKPSSEGWQETMWPMNYIDVMPLIDGWLDNVAQYPPEPNHDGSNGKGWRVYNENWGRVDGDFAVFVAIEPVWAMYGK